MLNPMVQHRSAKKLLFGQYEAKVEISAQYLVTDPSVTINCQENIHRYYSKYKNLHVCWSRLLEGADKGYYSDDQERDQYHALCDSIKADCPDWIKLYRWVRNYKNKKAMAKLTWRTSPNYVRRDQLQFTVEPKIIAYFYTVSEAQDFVNELTIKKRLPKQTKEFVLHSISDKARALIQGDKDITVMAKLPFGKYQYKIWINYHKLSNLPKHSKDTLSDVLSNFEEQGSIRLQGSLKNYLGNTKRFLWNSTYIYVDCEATKNLMDLILVNIISKYEHIKVENGENTRAIDSDQTQQVDQGF